MFGDTEIQPSVTAPVQPEIQPSPVDAPIYTPPTPPPTQPMPTPAPVQTFIPKPKPSILPLVFGFLIVIIIAALIGVVYYKNKLTVTPSPSPIPSIAASPSPEPSMEPSSTPSATPKSSLKPSTKPVSVIKTTFASPTPTPVPQPTMDIRFGNPSANVKQTIDEGKGDGRVINREYTSIQAGQFDEVPSTWSPRVTVCFHMVANEEIVGKDVKFSFSLDDKVEVQDNLGQYDKMEAGRMYDWCHDVTTSIGKHTAKLLINPDKSFKESNYVNDLARLDWENLSDKIAPNFTLGGPYNWTDKGTCFLTISPSDNINTIPQLKIEQKVDGEAWSPIIDGMYCFKGTTGAAHIYTVRITDTRGNVNEQNKSFVLY